MVLIKWQKRLNSVGVLDIPHRMFIPWWHIVTNLGYTFNLSTVNSIFCTIIKYYSVGVFYVDGFVAT